METNCDNESKETISSHRISLISVGYLLALSWPESIMFGKGGGSGKF